MSKDSTNNDQLINLLSNNGFETVSGKDAVLNAIFDNADKNYTQKLCSGYGVFPGGEKCLGCSDCTRD